jgi:hypothetical protein
MAQRNAEGFGEIVRAIERLARFRGATGHGLGAFRSVVAKIARQSPLAERIPQKHHPFFEPFEVLYESTQIGRNQAVHEGAYARNLARHAAELSLILEDALQMTMKSVQHFMVRNPTCAELWEPLALVRQKMLVNAFSFLPVVPRNGGKWRIVSDAEVARYLRSGLRTERLSKSLRQAVRDGLQLQKARIVEPESAVDDVLIAVKKGPLIVISEKHPAVILGVLTAFDLL